jgi:hypothetical protein
MSHLLVAALLEGLLSIGGLNSRSGYGIAILVVLTILVGVVSQMGAALALATLAELFRPCFLRDSFTGVSRCRMLLGTCLGTRGSR